MKYAVGPIVLQACTIGSCDLVWLVQLGPSICEDIDIEFYWSRDITRGPDPRACPACWWRGHFLFERKKACGLQTHTNILWADRPRGVGKDQPRPGAPSDEEIWENPEW